MRSRFHHVALRKESVDRKTLFLSYRQVVGLSLSARRAWIESFLLVLVLGMPTSLSARRAWIESPAGCWRDARRAVALRKESVDRKFCLFILDNRNIRSLSARRAWIESMGVTVLGIQHRVALRKESVDRKNLSIFAFWTALRSLSARRAWIERPGY